MKMTDRHSVPIALVVMLNQTPAIIEPSPTTWKMAMNIGLKSFMAGTFPETIATKPNT
jgi:hypothetical protein